MTVTASTRRRVPLFALLAATGMRASRMAGGPIAGVLIAVAGASQVLLVDAATFAVSAALLSMVVPRAVRAADEPAPGRYLTSCAKASRSSAMTR